MTVLKRLGVLFLLLSFLIPNTAFSASGDGDIPEVRPSAVTGNDAPQNQQDQAGKGGIDWVTLWDLIVDALTLLP
ncbi:MAG: hypothetical protein ABIK65_03945 [Candidatus Eisenbacteria bacterium]